MVYSRAGVLKIIVSILLVVAMGSPTAVAQGRFKYWICRVLGINVRTYDRLSRARPGEYQPTLGSRLMRMKLPREQEELIWECEGCWSPAMLNKTEAAVLKPDGIWLVPIGANATRPDRPTIAAPDVVAIVGVLRGQAKQLLVAQRSKDERCQFILTLADLKTARIMPLRGAAKCLAGSNQLFLSVNAGRVRDNKLLVALKNTSGTPRTLWLQSFGINQNPNANTTNRLIPLTDSRDDGVDRFDPNWISSDEVIYVTNP